MMQTTSAHSAFLFIDPRRRMSPTSISFAFKVKVNDYFPFPPTLVQLLGKRGRERLHSNSRYSAIDSFMVPGCLALIFSAPDLQRAQLVPQAQLPLPTVPSCAQMKAVSSAGQNGQCGAAWERMCLLQQDKSAPSSHRFGLNPLILWIALEKKAAGHAWPNVLTFSCKMLIGWVGLFLNCGLIQLRP